ncbi:hypothetical protein [Amedibacillus dolichus]|uniref:Uncharacterized protein n=1 Tax=Amedibacillus dolichus DSM 3991 TaxID=428127 RepID=A8RC33_9FIRM|nr:hypothetical protein [Amedibacillus dolichus]EDP11334.1 hypothetical protein EUBDOL_01254 [Amedibacillus dolichus DSM 3991]
MSTFIKTSEAVEILNHEITKETLQTWIRYGDCPLGVYVVKEGNSRGLYFCFKDVCEYVRDNGMLKLLLEREIKHGREKG